MLRKRETSKAKQQINSSFFSFISIWWVSEKNESNWEMKWRDEIEEWVGGRELSLLGCGLWAQSAIGNKPRKKTSPARQQHFPLLMDEIECEWNGIQSIKWKGERAVGLDCLLVGYGWAEPKATSRKRRQAQPHSTLLLFQFLKKRKELTKRRQENWFVSELMKWNVSELRNEINEINWMNQTRQWNGINEREGRPPKDNATKTNHSLRLGVESQQRIGVVVAASFLQSIKWNEDWLVVLPAHSAALICRGSWLWFIGPATTHSSFLFDWLISLSLF